MFGVWRPKGPGTRPGLKERRDKFDIEAVQSSYARRVPVYEKNFGVMAEIARVLRPGGRAVITNHFKSTKGALALVERVSAPFANTLGWHSDFQIETVLKEPTLAVDVQKSLPPLGMMTFLVLRKTESI